VEQDLVKVKEKMNHNDQKRSEVSLVCGHYRLKCKTKKVFNFQLQVYVRLTKLSKHCDFRIS